MKNGPGLSLRASPPLQREAAANPEMMVSPRHPQSASTPDGERSLALIRLPL
jgi:hypothetical protein